MQNRAVFAQDPTTFSIPNDGVTVVADPQTPEEWDVLRYELSSFVCDGEYREGLHRILSTFVGHLGKPKQPAVWVSGFYGSGKSHLVRVLQYLWSDVTFPDDAQARSLTKLPVDITDLLAELSTAGKREGGLWAAAGKLGAGHSSIQLDVLKIVFRSAGLPVQFAPARLVIWLKQKGIYEAVRAGVERRGGLFEDELQNMYVSQELAESIIDANPGVAQSPLDISELLVAQYPDRTEIDDDLMLQALEDVLRLQSTTPGKLPLTLLVFDELQQSIGEHPDRALAIQEIAEACSSHFGSRILFVGTGQAALEATPQLSKLQDRFTVRVSLEDKDVQQVVRQVVLRKQPDKVGVVLNALDAASGEINRHLAGTKIGPTLADSKDLAPDYPLLPTRRRFWERTLRAIDRAGTAAQLRTQLRVVHEANRSVAERPLGTVVGADILYEQQKSAMLQSGVLLREVAGMIDDQRRNSSADGDLRARLCALIFLLGELPNEGVAVTGVRATADTLADLLVEDLTAGSGSLRQQIPALLQQLVDDGMLMLVGGEYRLQTKESAEWEKDYRMRRARILGDDTRIATDRVTEFRNAIQKEVKGIKLVQGASKTPRRFDLHFGDGLPAVTGDGVPVWVRDEWSASGKAVRDEAQAAGVNSPVVFVLLPRQEAEEFKAALASRAAARETLDARPSAQATPEGAEARRAMETRFSVEDGRVAALVAGILANARVFQGGGNEIAEDSLQSSVEAAIKAALVRLFPNFPMADDANWGKVVKRASEGASDALAAVGYNGDADQHPVCKEVSAWLGAGKKGADVRKQFMGVGYGWQQDAVDGALLALVAAGVVRAEKSNQVVPLKQIAQSQIGVLEFRSETRIVSAGQRIQVRKLIQDMGLPVKPGEEAEAIPRVLQRLADLAADAGGPPPEPERPSKTAVLDLQALSGNDQFVAVYDARGSLLDSFSAWSKAKALREERRPAWETLRRLLVHAAGRHSAQQVTPQVDAILGQRLLLVEPDPVKPLVDALCSDLRQALRVARERVIEVREREITLMQATAEWNKLDDAQWRQLFHANHVGPVAELDIGTDEKLLRALDEKPLSAWETEAVAVPTRMRQAREQAAKLLEPKAVRVRPKSTTLHNIDEVDVYLSELRQDILEHVQTGKPVII
ncbi:MAG: BREX system P-loop protein BrxC [Caldilineales bacterium]|nr:BREX system P-loop protein BrxC [Caldilineales bacterium]MCW5881681.1 BREX system P-loop protein BrxC [Anaerolineae bacterium]